MRGLNAELPDKCNHEYTKTRKVRWLSSCLRAFVVAFNNIKNFSRPPRSLFRRSTLGGDARWFERDLMSQPFQALDEIPSQLHRRQPIEMLFAEFVIGHLVSQHVVYGNQQAVTHRDNRALLAASARQASILSGEVAALRAGG